jgi:hypothetical protein
MLKTVSINRQPRKEATHHTLRVMCCQNCQGLLLFFGQWRIHIFAGADHKFAEVCLLIFESLRIHSF